MTKKNMTKIFLLWILIVCPGCSGNKCSHSERAKDHKSRIEEKIDGEHQKELRQRRQGKERMVRVDKRQIHISESAKIQIDLKTVLVKKNPVRRTLKAMGKVLAPRDRKVIVGYIFTARIVRLHVSVGEWVKRGQPLVRLECEEVGNAKVEFFKARADFELLKLNFNREERLFKKDIGAKKDYLETKAQFQIAQANLNAAENKLNVLGFSKAQIKQGINDNDISPFVTVKSSISGRVIQNNAVLGAMIDQSTEIMVVMDPTILWIDAEIYEKDLAKIKISQKVQISVPAYPEKIFFGQIHYIGDVVNPETRTITVRTRVDNKAFELKPGMFADINIILEQKTNAVTVPLQAVLDDGKDKIVFVQEGDHFILRKVKIGTTHNGLIEILNGLNVGEIVVVEGNYQLKSKLHEGTLSHTH